MLKLRYIDAIRGIAILGVFMVHVCVDPRLPSFLLQVISLGAKGVQLFFIASAFTLFLSMDKRTTIEKYPLGNFFTRRFFRIAPMYYLGIIYYCFQSTYAGNNISPELVTSNILFVHGVRPDWINSLVPGGWSITVEMMFYCMVPFIFSAVNTIQKAMVFLGITMVFRLVCLVMLKRYLLTDETDLNHDFLYYYLPNQLPIFALGIFMYQFIRNKYSFTGTRWTGWALLLTAIIVNCVVRSMIPYHFFISIAFVLLFVILSKRSYKLFVNRFTIYLGKISFSLYLVHFAVNFWTSRWMTEFALSDKIGFKAAFALQVGTIFLLSVAISTLFYHFVELKMQIVGKTIIRKREMGALEEPA